MKYSGRMFVLGAYTSFDLTKPHPYGGGESAMAMPPLRYVEQMMTGVKSYTPEIGDLLWVEAGEGELSDTVFRLTNPYGTYIRLAIDDSFEARSIVNFKALFTPRR
jgi:hypothetical protein